MKGRALQWLAQREQSRVELRRKLMRHALREAAAQAASAREATESSVDAVSGPEPEPYLERVPEPDLERIPEPDRDRERVPGPEPDRLPAAARVDAVLDWLEAHEYLSQARFVESRVHARSERFGNLRIQQELRQHQVGLPAETAQALKDTELQRARSVRARKFSEPASDPGERARQGRFLAGRGFSADVIHRVLREPNPSDADDAADNDFTDD
ncbi:MAG: RecX family transcriptional regulator [Burkholderiaceae bacterium]